MTARYLLRPCVRQERKTYALPSESSCCLPRAAWLAVLLCVRATLFSTVIFDPGIPNACPARFFIYPYSAVEVGVTYLQLLSGDTTQRRCDLFLSQSDSVVRCKSRYAVLWNFTLIPVLIVFWDFGLLTTQSSTRSAGSLSSDELKWTWGCRNISRFSQ
jgi:hypothetical protein